MQHYVVRKQINVTWFQGYTFQLREELHASKSMDALLTHMPKPLVPQLNRSVILSDDQHIIAYLGFSHIETSLLTSSSP
jgi:hypothetical protein